MKISYFLHLIIILVYLLVIIFHSRLFWWDILTVSWNYEFTKVSLFNSIFPIIFIIYYLLFFRKIKIHKNIFLAVVLFYILLFFSTIFSEVLYTSLFWGNDRWHWFFFWNNLVLIFLFFYFWIQKFWKEIFEKIFLLWWIILVIFWFKELYFPSFEYWALWSRLLSTFGHPNYVAGYLVLLFPYIYFQEKKYCFKKNILEKYFYIFLLIFIILWILFTQSAIAIWLIYGFLVFQIPKISIYKKFFLLIFFSIISAIVLFYFSPEKFSSFISRFYIWETSLKIIFSDIKIFLFWIWSENLIYFFDNFKSPELYLYERIWFSTSRPHNIFLDFFIHFWIVWFISISYIFSKIILLFRWKNWYEYSCLFGFIFYFFHFPNLINYIFLSFIFCLFYFDNLKKSSQYISGKTVKIFIVLCLFIWILWSYFSFNFYQAERFSYTKEYKKSLEIFPYFSEYYFRNLELKTGLEMQNNFISEKYLLFQIYFSTNIISSCENLLKKYPTVENYFYCWEKIENKYWFERARNYYEKWLEKFPDIITKNNKYLNNFPGKYIINKQNIISPKFSNIQEIITKLQ